MTDRLTQDQLAAEATRRTLEMIDMGAYTPVILIDGRAASGKSTLAQAIQQRLFAEGESLPRIVHMDDLYPGWDGLAAGSEYLMRFVLSPVARGKKAEWQEYDWQLGERNRWREFAGGTPLIIEGCGALSKASAEQCHLSVWLEVDEATRHERWIARDGHKFDDQWPRWAAQELDFYAREQSASLADLIGGS